MSDAATPTPPVEIKQPPVPPVELPVTAPPVTRAMLQERAEAALADLAAFDDVKLRGSDWPSTCWKGEFHAGFERADALPTHSEEYDFNFNEVCERVDGEASEHEIEDSTAIDPAEAIPMWDHNGDSHTFTPTPADTHKDGIETDELPTVKGGAEATPQTFSFPNPRGFEPVYWDGNEATLPLDDAKKMLTLRYQYTYSAYVEQNPKKRAEKTEFLRRSEIIRRVCFAKEQGLPQIEMARLTSERVRHVGREATRKSNHAELEKFVESGDVSTAPLSLAGGDKFISGAIMEPAEDGTNLFPGLLVTARERLALYGLLWFGLWPVVNPTERAEEIKLELSAPAALTADRIIALQNELIGLESEAAKLAQTAAVARLNEAFVPVREVPHRVNHSFRAVFQAACADDVRQIFALQIASGSVGHGLHQHLVIESAHDFSVRKSKSG